MDDRHVARASLIQHVTGYDLFIPMEAIRSLNLPPGGCESVTVEIIVINDSAY